VDKIWELEILRAITIESKNDSGGIEFISDERWFTETEIIVRLQLAENFDVFSLLGPIANAGHIECRIYEHSPQLQSHAISGGINYLNANIDKLSPEKPLYWD